VTAALLAASILGVSAFASPANAQPASDCGQLADSAGHTFTYTDRNRSNSAAVMSGLVNAALQNTELDVPVTLQGLAANVSVVCVTDSLNGNHLEILKNIDVDVIEDVTIGQVIGDVNVLAIDTDGSIIYVAPQDFAFAGS
jgi:hypothetical protein